MKKILFFLLLGVMSIINAQSVTISMVTYNAADSSATLTFSTSGVTSVTNWEYSLGGLTFTPLTPAVTSTSGTINIPDANGYTTIQLRTNGGSNPGLTSNIFTTPTPLPVTWASFDVFITENGNKLVWKISSEQNTDYFIPEYSEDGINWNPIIDGKKNGRGNSSTDSTYEFVHEYSDKISSLSMVYYRIKQVDLDGKFSYSEIKFPKSTAGITPTTDKNIFSILRDGKNIFIKTEKDIPVSIADLGGRTRKFFSNNNINLETGMYLILINNSITKIVIE